MDRKEQGAVTSSRGPGAQRAPRTPMPPVLIGCEWHLIDLNVCDCCCRASQPTPARDQRAGRRLKLELASSWRSHAPADSVARTSVSVCYVNMGGWLFGVHLR